MKSLSIAFLPLSRILHRPVLALSGLVLSAALIILLSMTQPYEPASHRNTSLPASSARWTLGNAFPKLTFERPVELTHAGDGSNRLFVVEQEGRIRVLENRPDVDTAKLFLDLVNRVSSEGEMGLLGLAFHPRFRENGYFYVYYTKRNPLESVVARYQVQSADQGMADPATATVILRFDQPYDNHNGGKIAFGPDGYLYIATGDGGAWGDQHHFAQNRASLLGKILRIDVDRTEKGTYGIPADNPWAGNGEGLREEIFAYGLRNPWRFSFDRQSGLIWAGDVGQKEFEEVNIIRKGGNYGWRLKEGHRCYNPRNDCDPGNLTAPVHTYPRSEGVSITGGIVYRGSRHPSLRGKYLYADFGSGKVWALQTRKEQVTEIQLLATEAGAISAFGEDAAGEVYLLDHLGTIKTFVAGSGVK